MPDLPGKRRPWPTIAFWKADARRAGEAIYEAAILAAVGLVLWWFRIGWEYMAGAAIILHAGGVSRKRFASTLVVPPTEPASPRHTREVLAPELPTKEREWGGLER